MSKQPAFTVGGGGSANMAIKVQSKSLKEARRQSEKLEQESRNMEERLNDLKTILSRDKQERSGASSAIWGAGKTGNLRPAAATGSAPVSKPKGESRTEKENHFPKRIKVLKDIPIEVPKAPTRSDILYSRLMDTKSSLDCMSSEPEPVPTCKQCGKKPVTLSCMECGRNLCSMCFAKLHLKGDYKKHKSSPFVPQSRRQSARKSGGVDSAGDYVTVLDGIKFTNVDSDNKKPPRDPQKYSAEKEVRFSTEREVRFATEREDTPKISPEQSLSSGPAFDEEASAASFQEALSNWRQSTQKSTACKGTGGSAVPSSGHESLPEINFSETSLSYAERLLLKKQQQQNGELQTPRGVDSSRNESPSSDGSGDEEERLKELSKQREQLRNQVCSYLTPRENTGYQSWVTSEIEITEVDDTELAGFSDDGDTTICSVVEPSISPDAFSHVQEPAAAALDMNSAGDRTSTPAISEYDPGEENKEVEESSVISAKGRSTSFKPWPTLPEPSQSDLTPTKKPQKSSKKNTDDAKTRNKTKPVAKPTQEVRKSATAASKTKGSKPEKPKTPKAQEVRTSSPYYSSVPVSKKPDTGRQSSQRLGSGKSLTRAPSNALSLIASRKSNTHNYSSGLDQFFSSEQLIRPPSSSETSDLGQRETTLSIKINAQGTWMQDESLKSQKSVSLSHQVDIIDTRAEEDDISQELRLIDGLPDSSREQKRSVHRTPKRPLSARRTSTVHDIIALPVETMSDEEDENDDKALEDLEFELACNTGRTSDGMDRITSDLAGILSDMDLQQVPVAMDDSYYADQDQNYESDHEDFQKSVQDL